MFTAMLRSLFFRGIGRRVRRPVRRAAVRRERARWIADAWTRRRPSSRLRGGISLAAEGLEPRLALAAPDYDNTVDLVFNVPAATAALGLQIGVYSNASEVYLKQQSGGSYSFEPFSSLGTVDKKLPLITVAAPDSSGGPVTLKVALNKEVVSGELIMFVGPVNTGLPYASESVSTPKSVTNPAVPAKPDTFAQFEFNFSAVTNPGLDIDISSVDSTGFPFALVYPQSGKGAVGYPLNPLGITVSHQGLHDNFKGFLQNQGSVNGTSVVDFFEQSATYVQQQDPSSLQVVAPGDILSNGTIGPTQGFTPTTGPAVSPFTVISNATSTLAAGATYSYIVTAYSDNLIDGTQVLGETVPSTPITVTPLSAGGQEIQITWTPYRDPNTAGYNIYRYASTDGVAPTDVTLYNFVGTVSGMLPASGDYFQFTDAGLAPGATQISVATASPYGFNPLSEYYTKALKDFFKHYEAPNSFALNRDGVLWVGNTVEYAPTASWNAGSYTYRMLQLTAQNSTTAIPAGAVVNIYEPFFSTNTRFVTADAPPMPSWLQAGTSPFESPSEMVFGCDGVFASNTFDPDSFANGKLQPVGDIENSIVSAFNRGIATTFYDATTKTGLVPDNWASFPNFTTPQTVDRTTPSNNLYYAVTAVNVYGETTASATVLAAKNSTLTWANGGNAAPATHYNVYAGTSPGQLYLQTTRTSPTIAAPAFTSQATALPYRYFAPNSTSNFYASYVTTDSLLDPVKGVSINGLSYGYAYSDQGGVSTNLFFAIDAMPPTVAINLGVPGGPGFVTQLLPTATVGSAYSATIVPSGTKSATFAVDTPLPTWATLAVNGTITGTPTTKGSWAFTVQATSDGTTNTQSYVLSATTGAVATPLSAAGLAAGVLTLPQADVGIAYTAQVVPNGGAGGPYWLALDPTMTAQLPSGISLPIGSGPIASQNGVFTLTGTQTTAQAAGISVVMSDKTAAVASASYGISTAQFTLLSPGTGYKVNDQFPVTGGGGKGAAIVVKTVSGTGVILTWDVVPGTGFTSAQNLAVAPSPSKTGKGASFTVAANPGTQFQPVVTILNGGTYAAAPPATFYGGGAPAGGWTGTVQLTGTAVAAITGPATFTASATPPLVSIDPPTPGASLPFTMNLTVNPALAVTTTSLPAAVSNAPYNQLLTTNNAGTVTFSLASGSSLPAGLSLTPWGLITGKATTAAAGQPFTVTATDAAGGKAVQTFAAGITVTASVSPLQVTTASLPATAPLEADGKTAVTYSFNPFTTVSGGVGPYTYSLVNGTLPGLSIDATTGAISGTVAANAAGVYPFTVRVTDAVGSQAFAGLTLDVLGITAVNGLPLDPKSLTSLRADATVLTLEGAGFDATTPANNHVTLSSGTATVTAATATSLTLAITGQLTANADLTATVKNSLGTSATVTVATVVDVQSVTVTQSTATVAPFGGLVIAGMGFSTTPADNVVTLSSGTATVTAATATSLTLAFTSPPSDGSLTATVTVQGVASAPTQVATVAAGSAKPTVNLSPASILSSPTTLEITGTGFSTTAGETTVALLQLDQKTRITFMSLMVNSPTSLTLTGVSLGSYTGGIFGTVTVNGVASGTAQVGTAANALDIVPPSPDGFAANGSVLVINGQGFTAGSTVTVTPEYSNGPGTPFTVTPQFDSSNRLVLTGLAIPTSVLSFSALPSGSNYTSAPQVVFSGGGAAAGDQAVGYATINASKQVAVVYVTTPGSYTSEPTVTFSGGQPTIAGSSAAGTGPGLGTITGLSYADATSAQDWLTTSGGRVAPISGPGIPANAVIQTVNTASPYTLDFAFPSTSTLTPQSAAFSLGAAATTTVRLATLKSIQAAVNDPSISAILVANPLSGSAIAAPTVTGGTLASNAQGSTLTITGTGFQTKGTIDVQLLTGPDAQNLTLLDGFVATNSNGSGLQSVTVDSETQLSVTLAGPLPVGNVWAAVVSAGVPMLGLGGPVVVATVAAPSLTTSTTSISPKPITLTIAGNGFATASGSENVVTLFTGPNSGSLTPIAGAIVSVVATSSTGLQVTLDGAVPLPAGPLWATVSVDGEALGPAQIATVAATGQAPDITAATGGLAIAAPSLSIAGSGFSTTDNGNSVQLFTTAGKLGTPILVTAASTTALVVPLPAGLIKAGQLYATVTTAAGPSAQEQVATVVAGEVPTVTPSTLRLAANAPQFVIAGTGFSTTVADNTVVLSSGVAKVIAATATSLTLQLTSEPTTGPLVATVTSNGLTGSGATVATVVAASTPTVTQSTAVLPTSAATLVMTGSGFDTIPGGTNLVALSSGTVSKVTINSPTQLTVTLGSAPAAGKLTATMTVDGVASAATQVATVGSTPSVTPSSALLGANAGLLTITGTGFDPVAANNTVTLSSGSAIVLVATSEALVLRFTKQPQAGLLKAVVVSGGIAGTQATVATVYATVELRTGTPQAVAKTFTITGAGFDTVTPANNIVALSSGAGTVTKATATSLTLTFKQAPTPGPLTATVLVDGISNPAVLPVQVATVVPGPVSAGRSTLATSAATAAVSTWVTVTLQARDANGNPLTSGGARVAFTKSAVGTFSKVTDNRNGTYSATFTTARAGAQSFSATINGVKAGQTATTGFVFASQFPGSSLTAPWSVKLGGFTPFFGTAFGTKASNIAVYSGPVAATVTVSALVSNVAAGQFGGVVARYGSRTAHYRAGLVVEGGQTYAVIQAVGARVTTLSKQAVAFSGSGQIGFTVSGSSLTMTLNSITVGQATNRAYTTGTAGISGGTNVGFGDFSAG